ncbi:MAG: TMEM165/GDT1 family protein [Gammaproteobacteria bacterium]
MELKLLMTVFFTILLAELGDKTQLATLLFAADSPLNRLAVFLAASAALVTATAMAVLAGGLIAQYVSPKLLHYIAGAGFIGVGVWTLVRA